MAANPKNAEWWDIMMPLQAPIANGERGRVVGRHGGNRSLGLNRP